MSLRGVQQCQKLIIKYSKNCGSSTGVKDFVKGSLGQFRKQFPEVIVEVQGTSRHPTVTAKYVGEGADKSRQLLNKGSNDVWKLMVELHQTTGRRATNLKRWHHPRGPSATLQGRWQPSARTAER